MLHFFIVIINRLHKNTEIVHQQKVNNVQKPILAYIYNVQHTLAEDYQLDQVKFLYRFT